MEDAVDAVAHLELILEGLDVNVGGAAFERAHEHLVDKPDNRHLGRHVAQVGDVFLVADPFYRLRRLLIVLCIVAAVQSFDARGDFFLWLADDDWLGPAYVARCVEVLSANLDHAVSEAAKARTP